MFVDKIVMIRKDLLEEFKEACQKLREYYNAGDWFQLDMLFDLVESRMKVYYLAVKLSMKDLNLIFKKYEMA